MELEKTESIMERLIGRHDGKKGGPLLICFGAMHGNEPAGVKAIELVIKMLDVEHVRNPGFTYNGNFAGIVGNLEAYKRQKRYINKDINRNFHADLFSKDADALDVEDRQIIEIINYVRELIEEIKPSQLIILDLHTTSSHGGIFTICRDINRDKEIATALHAPVVLGMLEGLSGTTLHYFTTENMGVDTVPITFESGQHEERLSTVRAVAGIISCMKAIGSVDPEDVENHHEGLLAMYSEELPDITRLIKRQGITSDEKFKMKPGYENFQEVKKGEVVAENINGPIINEQDGLMLMPLYQEQGEDGFFIVKEEK